MAVYFFVELLLEHERGKIRKQSLDIYLSVGISFIVRDNTGNTGRDTCVARLFGIPKHFVSKDLL